MKWRHWYRVQDELINVENGDQKEILKRIGKIGVGNDRQNDIPMEVKLEDGTVSSDITVVMENGKNSFSEFLNCNTYINCEFSGTNINNVISDHFLDNELSIEEVLVCSLKQK